MMETPTNDHEGSELEGIVDGFGDNDGGGDGDSDGELVERDPCGGEAKQRQWR